MLFWCKVNWRPINWRALAICCSKECVEIDDDDIHIKSNSCEDKKIDYNEKAIDERSPTPYSSYP